MDGYVLRRWRKFAEWAAKIKGARRACDICKRAMMGYGLVKVRPPWPTYSERRRFVCSQCWADVCNLLDEWEYTRDQYDAPIDRVSRKESTGGGQRGTYTNR